MADKKTVSDILSLQKQLNIELDNEISKQKAMRDFEMAKALEKEKIAINQKTINELRTSENELTVNEIKELINLENQQTKINSQILKENKLREKNLFLLNQIKGQLIVGWNFLQQQDKVIKNTVLNLGLSGTKAELLRNSFEQSAGFAARLGGSIEDVQNITQGYADETGRARVLSAEMVKDIVAIGKGTGLGIEQAAKLGAQFELMGFDARSTMEYVQGVVDTSERMGVNTTKILKNINDNFKRLNTYTFQQGTKGFAQMAMYAEKFKIDIGAALNAADVAKSLEGAIDLAAQLQVMGGEFAKTDPFEMLFLSRNDPAKFTEKIADMTKGIVTFRKMSDGSFEKFISPADRDRLTAVAKSLGMEASELTQIAERQAEIQRMRQQMSGIGLSPKEKELIEGAAIFSKSTGKFEVTLAGRMQDISNLTEAQAKSFAKEQVLLSKRAEEAQTFDEAFKATINELKTALLPILQSVNSVLTTIRPYLIGFTEWISKGPAAWAKVGGMFLAAGALWKGALLPLTQRAAMSTIGALGNKIGGGTKSTIGTQNLGGGTSFKQSVGSGLKGLGKGAGVGAAVVGMGAGVGLAADGISKLADSMSKLTPEQAKALQNIATTLAITFPIAAIGIGLVASTAQAGALGLLALGAAIVGVGFGIKLAGEGIGKMSLGLAELNKSGGGAGKQLLGVATGVGAITLAMGAGGVPMMFAFNNSLARMSKNSEGIEKIGSAFKNIFAVLSGTKEDFIAVENAITNISKANVKGGSIFNDISKLLNKPLKVEFADKRISMVNDITLNLDGHKFMQKVYNANVAVQKHEDLRTGKG